MGRIASVAVLVLVAACGRYGFEPVGRISDALAVDSAIDATDVDSSPDAAVDAAGFRCGLDDVLGQDNQPLPTLELGTQCWLRKNLAIGIQVLGGTQQTNNNVVEKYCYNDQTGNCLNGLYQWAEAMQYVTTEGAQGICPVGWHIPSDAEWKLLERFLGMSVADSDAFFFRGNIAPALRVGGSAGFDAVLAGYRPASGADAFINSDTFFVSSTDALSGANQIARRITATNPGVERLGYTKLDAYTVRCVQN